MAIDERFTENLGLRNIVEALLHDVLLHLLEVLDVLAVGQLVEVDAMRFVAPEPDDLGGRGHALVAGEEESLEDVGEITEVEDVVELDGGWHEHL
jgi:hypothetical protein